MAPRWRPLETVLERVEARGRAGRLLAQFTRFGLAQAGACAFAGCVFVGLGLSAVLPLPLARYDALLVYLVAVTAVFWALRLESGRELLAILGFHAVGLAFELFKVQMGSWAYPEPALTKIGGVPLYSGFMYAAVGSYVTRAWRLLDLRLTGYRRAATAVVAAVVYLNFFAHHWLPDLRALLAVAVLAVTWGTWVYFTVGRTRYRMPLALSFVLIGFFLWLAENLATLLGAWRYPDQAETWTMVSLSKFGSWTLLVTVSFVLVVAWKRRHALVEDAPAGQSA